MLYFTGDTHGDIQRLSKQNVKGLKNGDTLFVCGDFGFIWDGSKNENKILDKLARLDFTICFVDGTHENFDLLETYPLIGFHGGRAHKIKPNVFHLLRGQLFDFEGRKVFTLGGGENPELIFKDDDEITDRPEVPSKEEMHTAIANMEKAEYKVDFVVTHEPPAKIRDFLTLGVSVTSNVTALGAFLDELSAQTVFEKWFFGSLHTDKFISNSFVSLFTNIVDAEGNLLK